MRRGVSIFLLLSGAAAEVAASALWWPHLGGGLAGAVAAAPLALQLHVAGALLFAAGAAGVRSWSMLPFYLVVVGVLPLLGMPTLLALGHLLSGGPVPEEEEEELEVGNPILERPSPGAAEVFLKPIARMMREEDAASIGRMILGLSKGGEAERGYQVLRRFQQDGDVELQFYAQNAQRGATEGLERHLKNLRKELANAPGDAAVQGALAEVLIALGGRRATSGSDANAYVRRALEHLRQIPEGARRAALEVRAYLLLREPASARAALGKLPEADRRRPLLEAEVLYAERDWERLAQCAQRLESTDARVRAAREFWRASA